jgi:hypothetical protein
LPLIIQLTLDQTDKSKPIPELLLTKVTTIDHQSQLLLQQILHDNAVTMVQEDVYSDDDEDDASLLMEEMVVEEQRHERVVVEDNQELAELLLQLEVVEPILEWKKTRKMSKYKKY